LFIDSAGNLTGGNLFKQNPGVPNPNPNTPINLPLCSSGNPSWLLGGNVLGNPFGFISDAVLGTCDYHDLIFEANSKQSMWIKPTGMIGVGTPNPSALLHVSTNASGSTPGLIIDQGPSSLEGPPEFNVNNDGSTTIYNLGIPGTNDPLSVNLQNTDQRQGGSMNTTITNVFRIATTGNVGIGNTTSGYKLG
jgi:hypothetical protein